jgi:hypothetical protein
LEGGEYGVLDFHFGMFYVVWDINGAFSVMVGGYSVHFFDIIGRWLYLEK